MADWGDVMAARHKADRALEEALNAHRGEQLAPALAAICLELRALGMIIDEAIGQHAAHVGAT